MSAIPHTLARRGGRGREEQDIPSLILGQKNPGRSSVYFSAMLPVVDILIVNLKMMGTMIMMMILLIQHAL
jgi:hypothetical protein